MWCMLVMYTCGDIYFIYVHVLMYNKYVFHINRKVLHSTTNQLVIKTHFSLDFYPTPFLLSPPTLLSLNQILNIVSFYFVFVSSAFIDGKYLFIYLPDILILNLCAYFGFFRPCVCFFLFFPCFSFSFFSLSLFPVVPLLPYRFCSVPRWQTLLMVTSNSLWCDINQRASTSCKPRRSLPGRSFNLFTEASKTYEFVTHTWGLLVKTK